MMRCVIYCSIASADWSGDNLNDLIWEIRDRDDPAHVAQRLVYTNGRFIQLIEGPHDAIELAYARIASDPRHHSLVTIVDRRAPERLFPEMATFSTPEPIEAPLDPRGGETDPPNLATGRADHPPSLLELITTASAGAITTSLRVVPRQSRAIDTVDRLLLAVERLVTSSGPSKLTVRDVAIEANVTSQTAYRYFRDTDDLLRVFVNRRQALVLQRIRTKLQQGQFTGEADLADSMISFVFEALRKKRAVPQAFWHFVLKRHHNLHYDQVWSLADDVTAAMRRCDIPCAQITRVEIASGLVAAIAAAKGMALYEPTFFGTPACRTLLRGLFQSPLGVAARS
jgi:AcrR family transcriptional regulator